MNKYNNLFPYLKNLGLNDSEIKVYLATVSIGVPQTSGVIAKRSSMKQSTTTMALKSLMEKGIVSFLDKGTNKYYMCESPEHLIQYIEGKEDDLAILKANTLKILPDIKKMVNPNVNIKPNVKVFEGEKGVKKILMEMIDYGSEILAYTSLSKKFEENFEDFWPGYFRKIVAKGRKVRVFVPDSVEGKAFKKRDSVENRQTILVSKDEYFFETEKHIVGDYVAHLSMHSDCLIAVLIEDARIASAERTFFNLSWDKLFSVSPIS